MKNKLRLLFVCFVCFVGSFGLSGCVGSAVTAAQAEQRLPAADIDAATVEISTVYGTSYQLTVRDVQTHADGSKTYGEYQSRFSSPAGSATVRAAGVKVKPPRKDGETK